MQPAPAPAVNECPQCTTPTRCGRTGDGKRGPRCVGRADGLDDCDCLNGCGDDPWLEKGKARPCARRAQEEAAAEFRRTAGPTEYASWFPLSTHGVQACDDWRVKAVAWLRAKADAQEATNKECPAHAQAYPSWTERVRWWRSAANDLEREAAALGVPGTFSDQGDNHG